MLSINDLNKHWHSKLLFLQNNIVRLLISAINVRYLLSLIIAYNSGKVDSRPTVYAH